MATINDYRKPNGTVDWEAYDAAKVEKGEKCYQCGSHIMLGSGQRTKCYECRNLEQSTFEARHDHYIRCPKCRHTFEPFDDENYECYDEGTHDANCPICDYEFEYETIVHYSYESPDLISDEVESNESLDEENDEYL